MTFPWETPVPAVVEPAQAPATVETVVAALQRDMAYMVTHTAVQTHSNRDALSMLANTPRGQIIPQGVCTFTDGTTLEFQDIGMPQVGAPTMLVKDLIAQAWDVAAKLGLELQK